MRVQIALVWTLMLLPLSQTHRWRAILGITNWTSLQFLPGAAMCFLALSVVYEERLVGDRMDWLTRPYSRRSLLLAKALFLLLTINLPQLIDETCCPIGERPLTFSLPAAACGEPTHGRVVPCC